MAWPAQPVRGRGAASNPANRFEALHLEPDPDASPDESPAPPTKFFCDKSSSILSHNESPDIGYDTTLNPYRGCEHGCIYCFARPTHEYLGFSAGLDFESKILVKMEAAALLRKELASKRWKPRPISLCGVTDCYQPVERRLRLTRQCLEVLAEFRNPVSIVTKNHLVTRDLDLLQELAKHNAVTVCLSISTLDAELARIMEPRTSSPKQRFAAMATMARAAVPVGLLLAPVVPALTDHEIISILRQAAAAGASFAAYEVLRLPFAVKELFEQWLRLHLPEKADKILNRIRALRGGKLNDSTFGARMVGTGIFARQIAAQFEVGCRKAGLGQSWPVLSATAFRGPPEAQLRLL